MLLKLGKSRTASPLHRTASSRMHQRQTESLQEEAAGRACGSHRVCRLLDSLTPRVRSSGEDSGDEDRTCPAPPSQHHWLTRLELDERELISEWANKVRGKGCSHSVSHLLIVSQLRYRTELGGLH